MPTTPDDEEPKDDSEALNDVFGKPSGPDPAEMSTFLASYEERLRDLCAPILDQLGILAHRFKNNVLHEELTPEGRVEAGVVWAALLTDFSTRMAVGVDEGIQRIDKSINTGTKKSLDVTSFAFNPDVGPSIIRAGIAAVASDLATEVEEKYNVRIRN